MESLPPLTNQSILCISSIDWDFAWQGHQEIMSALAQQGNRILFVENTGVRSPTLRDLPRLTHRIQNWWRGTKGFRQERENLVVYSPILLPFPYSRMAQWINRFLLQQPLRRWMRASRFGRPILWTFLPTPLVVDLIRDLDPELVIYYCVDNLAQSSKGARRIVDSERTILKEADMVFVTARKLFEKACALNPHVRLFPFGVQFHQFNRAREKAAQPPEELKDLRRPIVGYIGGIRKEINQDLLGKVAGLLPGATFVMVGPLQTDISLLAAHSNIRFLGSREHPDLPSYLSAFDAGIIPYLVNPYTDHIYPAKLNEYLAMGIPVVATDLTEVRHFNAKHGELVKVATDPTEFAQALKEVIQNDSQALVERRIEAARQNSWKERIEEMGGWVARTLAARRNGEIAWEESFRRVYRTTRRRLIRTVGWISLTYLVLFHTPLLWFLASPLRMPDHLQKADAIVVFAGGVGESGKAGEGYQERVEQAVNLYTQGYAHRILLVSGYTRIFEEADIMRSLMVGLGIPPQAIRSEKRVSGTVDYVRRVKEIASREGWRSCLLVTSAYHSRRADLTFARQAPELKILHASASDSPFYAHGMGIAPRQIRGILQEVAAILYYRLMGWL